VSSPAPSPRRRAHPARIAAAIAGGLVALGLTSGPPWPLTLAANLVHVVGVGAVVAAPLLWRAGRQRLASGAAGASFVLALVLVARWGVGPASVRADVYNGVHGDPSTLRVLTYNLGTDLAGGSELTEGLVAARADVIALQELSNENARACAAALADTHPHRVLLPSGIPGRGLFSRWPIVGWEWIAGEQERRHLRVRLDVDGRELVVWVLHLSMTMSFLDRACEGSADLDRILARERDARAVLLCGDLNTTERSAAWRRLRASGLVDAFRAAGRGPGFTFPIGNRYLGIPAPTCVRIDYVWHGPSLEAERAWVGPDLGSDHRPVLVDLAWRPASARVGTR